MFLNFSPPDYGGTDLDGCSGGRVMCKGVCKPEGFECPDEKVISTTSTINPMLILAAVAAAFFFAG